MVQNATIPIATLIPLTMLFGSRDVIKPRHFNNNNTLSPLAQNLTIDHPYDKGRNNASFLCTFWL
jgi:hypothetical protein